jgi:hypothetical protein
MRVAPGRRLPPRLIAALGAVAAAATATGAFFMLRGPDSIAVARRSDVVRLDWGPYPEGPQPPAFAEHPRGRELPLSRVLADVPLPLPAPGFDCTRNGGGATLTVHLRSGRAVEYGPHCVPHAIARLWGAMLTSNDAPGIGGPDAITAATYTAANGPALRFAMQTAPGVWPVQLVRDLTLGAQTSDRLDAVPRDDCKPDGSQLTLVFNAGDRRVLDSCQRSADAEYVVGAILHASTSLTPQAAWARIRAPRAQP